MNPLRSSRRYGNPKDDAEFSTNSVEDLRPTPILGILPLKTESKKRLRIGRRRIRKPHNRSARNEADELQFPNLDDPAIFPSLEVLPKEEKEEISVPPKFIDEPLPPVERMEMKAIKGEDGYTRIVSSFEYKEQKEAPLSKIALPFQRPLNFLSAVRRVHRYGHFKSLFSKYTRNFAENSFKQEISPVPSQQPTEETRQEPTPLPLPKAKSISEPSPKLPYIRRLFRRTPFVLQKPIEKKSSSRHVKPTRLTISSRSRLERALFFPTWHSNSNWNYFSMAISTSLPQKWQVKEKK